MKHRDEAPDPNPANGPDVAATRTLPATIGRFRVLSELGEGGFGIVYKARDPELNRSVAIKVPHRDRASRPEEIEAYIAEARILAGLDHPHIVPVYDVGRSDDGRCYVVSKLIEGSSLAELIRRQRPSHTESINLIATVAEALNYAHRMGLVHRDIKPANILIDEAGQPCVVDFGLALKDDDYGKGARHAGTPAYMSPEQARGEGHRVDGRSDIFSLGVVFYELLTGHRPFRGDTSLDVRTQIIERDPRPLRMWDECVPKELERICLKALSKRAADRYSTAGDLADDLRHFFADEPGPARASTATPAARIAPHATDSQVPMVPPSSEPTPPSGSSRTPISDSGPIRIVPKGLRSFGAHDADFFLELVPGPRDRTGLPESIRFWKTRIESVRSETTFAVGLLYGPSGCGKSSLVKAGLLPRLTGSVIAVYVEATASDTESRLRKNVLKACPQVESAAASAESLPEILAALRRGRSLPDGRKLLIVLDQFEQWLHAHAANERAELVEALRQCDGERVQCLLLVRDDFWMAATRFMRELEAPLMEGRNSASADLFDPRHARKVLAAFGRAFGVLGDDGQDKLSDDQLAFIDQSIAGLAQDGKVVSVRLALFAEMMKGRPWTPQSLKAVGGAEGVGVTFLEETFSASTAPPQHRYHQQAARAVLQSLLPDQGTDIKGHLRSRDDLLAASGYASRPREFDELLDTLDSELRLITPADGEPEAVRPVREMIVVDRSAIQRSDRGAISDNARIVPTRSDSEAAGCSQFFQLTHDFLVPSLRDWLTKKQRETRRGRAELLLAERAAAWTNSRERRHLPNLLEFLNIRWFTAHRNWSAGQRQMMRAALAHHSLRSGLLTALGILLVLVLAVGGPLVAVREAKLRGDILTQKLNADRQTVEAEKQEERANRHLYVAHMNLAQTNWETANMGEVRRLLDLHVPPAGQDDLRGFEWYYLDRQCNADLFTLKGHTSSVKGVAFSPDGKRLASASDDRTVKVWDATSGQETLTLKGHTGWVTSVAFSADGKRLATSSKDGTIKTWDTTSGQERLTLKGHTGNVYSVAFSPDGKRLATAGDDRTVKVWDATSGQETLTLKGHADGVDGVAFSSDGKRLASASEDRTVKVWDATSGQETLTFKGHTGWVTSVAFSPDGKRLASASDDQTVKVWDATSGQETLTLKGHTIGVASVAFSPDGNRLASAGDDRTVKLWDATSGQESLTFKGHTGAVQSVAFNPDGKRLASAGDDRTVKVWDLSADRQNGTSGQESLTLKGQTSAVRSVVFSADGKRLASANDEDQTVKVWDATSGQETLTLKGHAGWVTSVAFSPDGKRLASASEDRTVKVWDLSADRQDATSGQETLTFKGHADGVSSVAISADGNRLATASYDKSVKVWDATSGEVLLTLKGHASAVWSVAYSADGKRLASSGGEYQVFGEVKVWDSTSGQETLTLKGHTGIVRSVAFSPDGKRLASSSDDRAVKVWDSTSGQETLTLKGHTNLVWGVAFTPDGKRLASASNDRTVKVWDATSGQETLTLKGHTSAVTSVAFSPDGKRLASACGDGSVKVWDARPLTAELRDEREALGVLRFLAEQHLAKDDFLQRIVADQTIRESVRTRALELAPSYWEADLKSDAMQLLAPLFAKVMLNEDVLETLAADPSINPTLRSRAIQLAREWIPDSQLLNSASWEVVKKPNGSREQYERAVRLAEEAVRLKPDSGLILNTLGVAQYRVGNSEAALATLTRSNELNSKPSGQSLAADLAFLAMTHHQLGHAAEAQQHLQRLREILRASPNPAPEDQQFLSEAEALIGSKP